LQTLSKQPNFTREQCELWQKRTQTTEKIKKALDFMRQQFLEVPFIAFYRYAPLLVRAVVQIEQIRSAKKPDRSPDPRIKLLLILKIVRKRQDQCCGSASGIRDPVLFYPPDPGSGMEQWSDPDPGFGIRDK
jgi:hypothetical protein